MRTLALALALPLTALAACERPTSAVAPAGAASQPAGKAEDGHGGHGAREGHGGHGPAGSGAATGAPERAGVYFVFPQDGSKIFATSRLAFGVTGMTVTPAGEHIADQTRGHHHLILDGEPVPKGTMVPSDARHIHFGKGQTEAEVKLTPGKHTLTLQFADGAHISYGPALSKTLTVEVVPDPPAQRVSFLNLKDGDKLKSPVELKFGIQGFTVRPAGEDALDKTSGHHHVIVDGQSVPLGQVVPADDKHIHFGKGQTETRLELPPGEHTLTLQLADGAHASYGPALSASVSIEVE